MAFRELDTLHPIFTTPFQSGWRWRLQIAIITIIAVGDSAGLDQDSVATITFKGMDTKSALPTAEKSKVLPCLHLELKRKYCVLVWYQKIYRRGKSEETVHASVRKYDGDKLKIFGLKYRENICVAGAQSLSVVPVRRESCVARHQPQATKWENVKMICVAF